MADKVSAPDARHLRNLEDILDKPVLHAFLLSADPRVHRFGDAITALPAGWFLGV